MTALNDFFTAFSSVLWGWPMIILLLGTHLFLTIRLRFPQRKIFKAIKLSVSRDKDAAGDVSQFGALATALAATIGTGNIIGVATAIALGGPGAVLWCWLTGVFGISTKYAEGLLAVKYRVKTRRGRMLGGPMYALQKGLGWKWLAVLFALFASLASFGIGSTVQANAISTLIEDQYGITPWLSGAVICALGAAVILGGVKSISKVCGMLVPFMAIFYVLGCIYILVVNHAYLMPAIKIILESAFTTKAAGGGFAGSTLMLAARYGIARGLFSNESGLGSAPIVAAAAQTRNPVRQALVSSTATFWDTVIICALTGLVITSSIIAYPDIDYHDGAAGFGGGVGRMRMMCGAVSGIVMLVGLECGQEEGDDREGKSACYKVVQELLAKSKEQNGSIICAEILGLKGHEKAQSSYVASPRTAEYYKTRPCAAKVESAARIFAEYLLKVKK